MEQSFSGKTNRKSDIVGRYIMEEDRLNKKELKLVVFALGQEEYAVNILGVHEIIKMLNITRVPKTPYYVEGVINLRGNIIPVVSLRKRFGLNEKVCDDNSRIIIGDIEGNMMGMIVDAVSEVVSLDQSDIEPPPQEASGIESSYLSGVGKLNNRLLLLLNLELMGIEKQ